MSRREIGAGCGLALATIILMLPGVGTLEPIGVRALAIIVLVAVLFFGCAMDRTGLAPRTDAPPTRHPLCDTGPRLAVRVPVSIDGIIRPREETGDLRARGGAAGVALGGARLLERRV